MENFFYRNQIQNFPSNKLWINDLFLVQCQILKSEILPSRIDIRGKEFIQMVVPDIYHRWHSAWSQISSKETLILGLYHQCRNPLDFQLATSYQSLMMTENITIKGIFFKWLLTKDITTAHGPKYHPNNPDFGILWAMLGSCRISDLPPHWHLILPETIII